MAMKSLSNYFIIGVLLLISCSGVSITTGDSKTNLKIELKVPNNIPTSVSGSSGRFVATDSDKVLVTVSAPLEPAVTSTFFATTDLSGNKSFSIQLKVISGVHTFSVDTYDVNNNHLTHGDTTAVIGGDTSTVTIVLAAAHKIYPGQSFAIAANETTYFEVTPSTNLYFEARGTGTTFFACAPNGTYGAGASSLLTQDLVANQTTLVRVQQGAAAGTITTVGSRWKKVAQLTDTTSYPTLTAQTGWEFLASLNNSIYFAIPNNVSGVTQFFLAYNVATQAKTNLNLSGNDLAAAGYMSDLIGVNGKLYYFANTGTSYDPSTNLWGTVSYPSTRGEPGSAVMNNKIYYFGSRNLDNNFSIFDTTTTSWSTSSSDINHATSFSAVASYNSKLYVFGGQDNGLSKKVSVYDPSTDTWQELADIPVSAVNSRPKAVTVLGKIYLFSSNNIYIFDPTTLNWDVTSLAGLNGSGTGFVTIGTDIYTVEWDSTVTGYCLKKFVF